MKLKFTWTVPNILTTIRLAAIPFMAVFIYMSGHSGEEGNRFSVVAFSFFVSIWVTDMLDGYIARHFNQISDFGKIYDPFVDKLFQFTTAFVLFLINRIPLWVVVFIIVKEVIMLLGGIYLMQKRSVVVHSKWYGKASTVLFVIALASVFFIPASNIAIIHYVFIPPVLMSSFATVCYGITLIRDSSKVCDEPVKSKDAGDHSTEG
jgi:CDP-diacylglycerol--glycerol-3-phosphate 3-phosphatidyltransferase